MAETDDSGGEIGGSVLRRKAAAGRPRPLHPIPGPQKAVRLALARAGQKVPGLDLAVAALEDTCRSLAEVIELLPERPLLAVLEGPGEGLGLVALGAPVLGAIVEVQTTGRIAPGGGAMRRPTRTDAAMTADFIDAVMTLLEGELDEAPDRVWAGGFRYASFLDDPRPLGLLLDDIPYRVFRAELDLGHGARRGEVLLALPAEGRGRPAPPPKVDTAAADRAAAQAWSAALDEAVMAAPADLTAVLHRLRIPLAAVMRLKPGDLVPVSAGALEKIELEGIDGRRLGEGKLGQHRGLRAVRLTQLPAARHAARAAPPDAGGQGGEPPAPMTAVARLGAEG